jgi:predicted RecA/RadA family phage recombinase
MKTFIQNGDVITIPAPMAGITSGDGVLVGNLFGVAANTAAEGEPAEVATTGVFTLRKATSAVLALGAQVAWDNAAKLVTTPGTGLYAIGVAVDDAGNGAATVAVRLDGIGTVAS